MGAATNRRVAAVIAVALALFGVSACNEDFDPPTLITELRVIGIVTDPADLVPLETAQIASLVTGVEGGDVAYRWELCLVTSGPDEGYQCQNELLGFPEEMLALFDLGDGPTAEFPYLLDAEEARATCESLLAELPALPDFFQLPDCDAGFEVTLRLTVATETVTKVAIKRLFLWFDDPGDETRNHNPTIDSIAAGGATLGRDEVILVEPGGRVRFDVVVPTESQEMYVREDEIEVAELREEVLFSWFSTDGEWERAYTYTEDGRIDLAEAGTNWLLVGDDVTADTEIMCYFVIRDGRGGADWARRVVRVVVPDRGD